ncbi:MAG: hypothetical protein EPN21_20660 [Methylococcaceae bacterium]|nr:MAG: hypothetical protein EPN21_20660 [Methylococcaceae bacterium]
MGNDGFRLFGSDIASTRTITDFSVADDRIDLARGIFSALPAIGALNAANFIIGTAAQDADDYLVYNSGGGELYYDADGNGAAAAVKVALLSAGLAMTSADFMVY